MKRILITLLFIPSLLAACGPAPTPQPTADIDATVSALSGTIVAGTLTAQPTATPLPTSTPTPLPPTATVAPTETATATITTTPVPLVGSFSPAGLKGSNVEAVFRIENNTSQTLKVFFNGITKPGNKPIYYEYEVNGSFNFLIAWGTYDYAVQIGTKRTLTGKFGIGNDDKTTMRVFDNKIVVVGP